MWEKLGRAKPATLQTGSELPELPAEIAYLWEYFGDLSMAVTAGGFGVAMATWDNIKSWATLMRVVLDPWEARMLARLSVIRANVLNADDKTKKKAKS